MQPDSNVVRLDGARAERRLAHWRGIVRSACEQCGRSRLPDVDPIRGLEDWLAACDEEISWRDHPGADLLLLAEFEEGYPKGWGPFKTESELSDLFGVVRAHIVSRPGARDNHSYWDRSLETSEVLFAR